MSVEKNALLSITDRCVKCGLCLPACPTYVLSGNEAESPRGRIALIEGFARGQLSADEHLIGHLDRCLQCRRCETRCPSGVPYGRLIDDAWALIRRPATPLQRLQLKVITTPALGRGALRLNRLLPHLPGIEPGLQGAATGSSEFRRFHDHYPAQRQQRGRVGLFLGCIARSTQNTTLHAAIRLLTLGGYEVFVPSGQACCGAMHAHSGNQDQAARMAANNTQAFAGQGLDVVVSLATGCGQQLDESGQLESHQDINRFLADQGVLKSLSFSALPARALLHTPCSLSSDVPVSALLEHIPELRLSPLTSGYGCCGAAGRHLLSHPEQGRQLRAPLVADIVDQSPDYLLTSNPGCALHLASGIADTHTAVLHPVELLLRQCAEAGESA